MNPIGRPNACVADFAKKSEGFPLTRLFGNCKFANEVGRSGMKWVLRPGSHVQGTVSGDDGREGAPEHPGEIPGRAGTLRGARASRHARRRETRDGPAYGGGAVGTLLA